MSCESLVSVQLNEGLEIIGQNSFAETGLEHIEFPSTLLTVMSGAFYNCQKLKSVKVNEGLQNLSVSDSSDDRRLGSFE